MLLVSGSRMGAGRITPESLPFPSGAAGVVAQQHGCSMGTHALRERRAATGNQRSLTYGRPIALGAMARPTKPASRSTVAMYGSAWIAWVGTVPRSGRGTP